MSKYVLGFLTALVSVAVFGAATPKTLPRIEITGASQALSATRVIAKSVIIYAEGDNSGPVRVGDENVSITGGSERGIPIAASGSLGLAPHTLKGDDSDIFLDEVYVIGTASDAIQVLYLQ